MKAFLHKKWGNNYAGQTLTGVEKGSIPAGVAEMYEDDEATPSDVIREDGPQGEQPLAVKDDSIDVERVRAVGREQKDKVNAAKKAVDVASQAAQRVAEDREFTQRQAREADVLAGKRARGAQKGAKRSAKDKARNEAGKAHTVK
jgi:hypothetical protein